MTDPGSAQIAGNLIIQQPNARAAANAKFVGESIITQGAKRKLHSVVTVKGSIAQRTNLALPEPGR